MTKIKIGKFDVDKDDAWIYIQHFGRDKSNIFAWEKMRKYLHDYIFENLGLDRNLEEGVEFRKAFDEWAEPHILKLDPITAGAKRLSNSETKEEREASALMLKVQMAREEIMARNGFRKPNSNDRNLCRVCKAEMIEGIPRYNDHLGVVFAVDKVNAPICMDCAENKPDEYHVAFKRQQR